MRWPRTRELVLGLRQRLTSPPALRAYVRLRRKHDVLLAVAVGTGILYMIIHWS